jgi:uncharacterized protein (DUF58 family)
MLPTRTTVWLFLAVVLLGLGGAGVVFLVIVGASSRPFLDRLLGESGRFGAFSLLDAARWLVLGLDGGVFALFLLDGILARRRPALRVRRDRPARLSIGVNNEITLVVENIGSRGVRFEARDAAPPLFRADPAVLSATVPPYGTARLTYQLLPTERGDFAFGDVYLRCDGPLGLARIDLRIPAGETVPVYPNLLEVRRYEALLRSTLVRTGGYRTRRLIGGGKEFSHFRDYTVDDDYKAVNWKMTARRAKPITAIYESEHSQDIIFCLDVGRMMAAKVGNLTKLDHAINAVLMLTHVSQAFQDNLSLLVFSHTVHRYLPPNKGRSQHAQFLQALYSVKPELCYVDYKQAFQYLIGRHPKRALTMIFTDLLDSVVSAEFRDAVRLLRRYHLPLTLAVADVPLQELAARPPQNADELYDILVARDLLHGRAEMLRSLEREGVMVIDTVPERLTVDAVNRYLTFKTGVRG